MSMWTKNQIEELWRELRALQAASSAAITYGTGDPPGATGVANGTIYVKITP